MIVLEDTDKIQGDASSASKVDYTLHGIVVLGSVITQLADGQLLATIGDLYTASGKVMVTSITLVNTDTVDRTVNLYVYTGTARRVIPKNMTLAAGYSLMFDGTKFEVIDTSGKIQQSIAGGVVGPASSTDHAVARFDGATGKIIQNSIVTIDDSGALTLGTDLAVAEGGTGRSVTVAYTPVCGGTTTTAAMQSVASVGTAGQVLTSNGAAALPTFQTIPSSIQGVSWNESADTYTRTDALAGQTLGVTLSDSLLPIHANMKRCLLNDAGTVQYYLDPADSTKKADGSASVLTGADGQVMVEIPAFYYRHTYSGTTHTWKISQTPQAGFGLHPAFMKNGVEVACRYIGAYEGSMWDATTSAMVSSANIVTDMYAAGDKLCSYSDQYPKTNETRAEFRGMAASRGTGWRQQDYDLISAIQLLYLVEYANFNSQTMIGMGRTELSGGTWVADSYIGQCGKSNANGNGTASVGGNTNNAYMVYRGIENFFGNVWKFVDGININSNVPYVSNNDTQFADDTATNYTSLGVTLAAADGWQATLSNISRGFLPATVGGSSSTKVPDYYYQASGWGVALLGGYVDPGADAGAFSADLSSPSSAVDVDVGGRLAF